VISNCRYRCAWCDHGIPAAKTGGNRDESALGFVESARASSISKVPSGETRDIDLLIQVFVEIETILAEHIQPGRPQDPDAVIEGIFRVMDRADVSAAVERLAKGYGRMWVVE
jgi:hypothetical protein